MLLRAVLAGATAVAVMAPATAALADPTLAQIEQQIETKSNEVEKVIEAYNKVNEDLKVTQAALAELTAKMQPLQVNVDKAQANVGEIAMAAYRTGSGLRTVSLLLSAGSSDAFVDQLATLEQLSRNQRRDIAAFTDAKKGFDAEKKRLDELLAAQNAQKTDLETKKTKIEGDIAQLEVLQKKAIAAGRRTVAANSNGTTTVAPPSVSGSAGKAVAYAYAQLGKPYQWGAAGPNSFDCSGLTMMAWAAAGVSLPHNAASQWSRVRHISRSQLAPGDLVFYSSLGHVGIYIGGGNIIHAPHTGDVVRVAGVDRSTPYGYGRPG